MSLAERKFVSRECDRKSTISGIIFADYAAVKIHAPNVGVLILSADHIPIFPCYIFYILVIFSKTFRKISKKVDFEPFEI